MAEEVSRQPPAIYREKLAPFLTPIEEVLRTSAEAQAGEHDGVVLLDEELHFIDEKGRRYFVDHRVNMAVNDSGAKEIAEDVHQYRKANQKFHLISAQTILPDGTRMPIRPGAVIMQSPQRQADYSLYDDAGEVRLIFPNVKPGAITESIVLIEESRFRIPGEYTAAFSWGFGWPIQKLRRAVDLPNALAERMRPTTMGHGIPEAEKQPFAKDRTRFIWASSDVDPVRLESNRPPTRQVGPVLWLTTLADWDALVKWYAPLADVRANLKAPLKKQIDDWTKSAQSPAEILEILMAKVATDIRYTGLEFGDSDLQPHDCNDVWENQYGDCKDKANLLRSMLRHKGIAAYLTLINTDHAGLIERRSPDFRQFNHAIVTVELEPGKYVFCDPTISQARPGLLSPSDADREVLIIKSDTAAWARTPPQDAGILHYEFDLKLAADGELSGWVTQETQGYYAVGDAGYYRKIDKDRTREKAREIVQGFFKGAQIIDVALTPFDAEKGVHRLKAYFLVPGTNRQGQSQASLAFPQSSALFVNPGARKERETAYYLWRDLVKVTARIQLPDGYGPAGLPRPFQFESKALDGSAQWNVEGNVCHASLQLKTKESFVSPDQFGVFYNALHSLHSWLDQPVTLVTSKGNPPAPAAQGVTLENFPIMANGDGQLALVDQRFPGNGDPALRREALHKVMQYFPTDKPAVFNAGMKLAIMDWTEDKAQEAVDQIQNLMRGYRESINAEDAAWGEYMLALALIDVERSAESLQIFERLGGNRSISARRRAWSAYQRAKLLEAKSLTSAIKILREGLAFETDAQPAGFTLLAKLLIADGRMADLKKEIKQMVEKKPPQMVAILTRLADSLDEVLVPGKPNREGELMQILEEAGKSAELGERFGEALQTSRDRLAVVTAAAQVRDNLKKQLAKNPLPEEIVAAAARLKTPADFVSAIANAEKEKKPHLCVGYGVTLLTRFEPDAKFAAHLWTATNHADWKERFLEEPEPLFPFLLDMCDKIPPDNDTYVDGRLLRARASERREDIEGAQKIHEDLLRLPTLSPGFKVAILERLGGNLEKRRDYRKALDVYREIEALVEFASGKDAMLRAVFLHLGMGNREEALRVLGLLAGRSEKALKQAETGTQMLELVALAKERKNIEAYWDATAQWWPAWLALEKKLGKSPAESEQVIPSIPELETLGADLGNALRAKDRDGFCTTMRTLAHAARWQPSMTIELFSLLFYAPQIAPECTDDVRKFVVTVSDHFVSGNSDLARKNQMYAIMSCIDSGQSAKAIKIVHDFNRIPAIDDAIAHAIARLWAMAAQRENREIAEASAALEKAVASTNLQDRRLTVTMLADLYRLANRAEDEESLLKRELQNPLIKAAPADFQALTARHQQASQAGVESKQFSHAVEKWLSQAKPSWFDYAEPKSLEDPRLTDLDAVLKEPHHLFIDAEIVKLRVLVAQSTAQTYARRQEAFLEALEGLIGLCLTTEEARKTFDPIVDDPAFPESFRVEALWRAIFHMRLDERKEEFAKLRAHPLVGKFNEMTKASVEILHEALAVDTASVDAIAAFCDRRLQKELTHVSLMELRTSYGRLLASGQIDAAEKIYRRLSDAIVGAGVGGSKTSLQMEFLKALNRGKRWAPASAALREKVIAAFPADSIQVPALLSSIRNRSRLEWVEENAAQQIRLYQVKERQVEPGDVEFWKDFIHHLASQTKHQELAFDLIRTALEHAPTDAERSPIISMAVTAVDLDDDKVRAKVSELAKPYRKIDEFPVTYAEIRMLELHSALRLGQPVNLETDFAQVVHPNAAAAGTFAKLRHYLQTGQLMPLRKSLESISPDDLLSDRLLGLSIRAFAAAGMNDELELARSTAKKSLYRSVLLSWVTLEPYFFHKTFELVDALQDSSALPPEWFAVTSARLSNRHANLSLRARESFARKDWPRLLQVADEAILAFPTYYHFHFSKGAALFHLHRKEEGGIL